MSLSSSFDIYILLYMHDNDGFDILGYGRLILVFNFLAVDLLKIGVRHMGKLYIYAPEFYG